MRETIEALIKLQSVDDEIREFKIQRDELATNLERLKSILGSMSSELDEKREKLAEANRFYVEQQGDLKKDGERLSHAKQKLATVTRTKEYAAMQRELDTVRRKYSEDESKLKSLAEAIEDYKASIATQEEKLTVLQDEVAKEEGTNSDRLNELTGQIAAIDSRRGSISTHVPQRLIRRYERVLAGRDGKAVIAAKGGKCTGCQMRLPPQLFIQVQRWETLESCPTCNRFLFHQGAEETA